jgi:hypothetical protein
MSAINRWWRDYQAECLDWWLDFAQASTTTVTAQVLILLGRDGSENVSRPLREIVDLRVVLVGS